MLIYMLYIDDTAAYISVRCERWCISLMSVGQLLENGIYKFSKINVFECF